MKSGGSHHDDDNESNTQIDRSKIKKENVRHEVKGKTHEKITFSTISDVFSQYCTIVTSGLGNALLSFSDLVNEDPKLWRGIFGGMVMGSAMTMGYLVFKKSNYRFAHLSQIPVSHFRLQRALSCHVVGVQATEHQNAIIYLRHRSFFERFMRTKDLDSTTSLSQSIPCRLYGVQVNVPHGILSLQQHLQFPKTRVKATLLYTEEKPDPVAVCHLFYWKPILNRFPYLKYPQDAAIELVRFGKAEVQDEFPSTTSGHSDRSTRHFASYLRKLYKKQLQAQRNDMGIWEHKENVEIGDSALASAFWKLYRIGNKMLRKRKST